MSSSFNKQETIPILSSNNFSIKNYEKIGPYKIKSFFKKGGMSILYLGIHPITKKNLIIKVLPPNFSNNISMKERFLKEAKIISISKHPNIISLYGQGEWEKGLYIAMEFIQGVSLRQFIQNKAFSTTKALEIILQVSYALNHLHNHNIIHRDLKPENILITEDGEIKVIDFGISQLKELDDKKNENQFMGTPVYMSPEQKKDCANVSFQTDIYSLGIITYELLLGKLSHGIIQMRFLPENLQKIISKAIKKDVSKRYKTIVDFIFDISKYLKEHTEKIKNKNIFLDDILTNINSTYDYLFPKHIPQWSFLDIDIKILSNSDIYGIYLDYFKLPNNYYLFILIETKNVNIQSINYISILKGMIKAHIHHYCSEKNNSFLLSIFLNSLNQILLKENLNQLFVFNIFLLNPEDNYFIFTSCKEQKSFHITNSNKKINHLNVPSSFLGETKASFVEIKSNWNLKDDLILFSSSVNAILKTKNVSPIKKIISANMIYPGKMLATRILNDLKNTETKNPILILSIHRKA